MAVFLTIVLALPVLTVLWWWWADRKIRRFGRTVRGLLAVFVLLHVAGYLGLFLTRIFQLELPAPRLWLTTVYIWHLITLPLATLLVFKFEAVFALLRLTGLSASPARTVTPSAAGQAAGRPTAGPPTAVPPLADGLTADPSPLNPPTAVHAAGLSRRDVLALAAVALPPTLTLTGVAQAAVQMEQFRTRRIDLPLAGLPRELAGLRIVHLSDIHVGRFTGQATLDALAERTNQLRPDLVAITGDTIDFALADLPAALEMVHRLDPRYGVFMCEGNHDLFEGREAFEERVRSAGVPLLLNERSALRIRGVPVEVLGQKWGAPGRRRDPLLAEHAPLTLAGRDPEAFAILLAHHPHAFDAAAAQGVPLTLAGHTHGGQLMLSPTLGAGPALFKYWSGLYRRGASALVVSNGVGNWFPLRINAPAEIILITLQRA